MRKHRNPRQRLSKRPSPDNFDPGILINQLYEDLVEVEALAITADEAVTQLPPRPPGKYGKTLARLYTLVGKTSGRAQGALERGEELMALRAAQLMAQVPKRSAARRAVDRSTLEKLLHHATFAAHLVGHLDDDAHRELIRQLGDHVDTIVHELTELLGAPSTLAEQDAAAPDDRGARDGAPMLTSIAGGGTVKRKATAKRPSPDNRRALPPPPPPPEPASDGLDGLMYTLRDNLRRADAFISTAERQIEENWHDDDRDESDVEEEFNAVLRHRMRIEYLVEAGKHAVRAALYTTEQIDAEIARRRSA